LLLDCGWTYYVITWLYNSTGLIEPNCLQDKWFAYTRWLEFSLMQSSRLKESSWWYNLTVAELLSTVWLDSSWTIFIVAKTFQCMKIHWAIQHAFLKTSISIVLIMDCLQSCFLLTKLECLRTCTDDQIT